MHLLWKYDRKACDGRNCLACTLAGSRPPQIWRATGAIERGLKNLDALVFPSRHALEEHRRRGFDSMAPLMHIPYFLPDDWTTDPVDDNERAPGERPYLAAAGRLVRMKGFQRLIPLMKYLPEVDLRIAGTGPYEPELRRLAEGLSNVKFEGLLGGTGLATLFRNARAVVVPSLFPETFGYVVLEAFAVKTPVIVHSGGGAIQETGVESGGGLGYRTDDELLVAMRRIVHDRELRDELAERGYHRRMTDWSESQHLERYFQLIDECKTARVDSGGSQSYRPNFPRVGSPTRHELPERR